MVKCFNKRVVFIPCTKHFLDPISLKNRVPISEIFILMIGFRSSFPLVSLFSFCWSSHSQIFDYFNFSTNFLICFLLLNIILSSFYFPEIRLDFSSKYFSNFIAIIFTFPRPLSFSLNDILVLFNTSPVSLKALLIYIFSFIIVTISYFPFACFV